MPSLFMSVLITYILLAKLHRWKTVLIRYSGNIYSLVEHYVLIRITLEKSRDKYFSNIQEIIYISGKTKNDTFSFRIRGLGNQRFHVSPHDHDRYQQALLQCCSTPDLINWQIRRIPTDKSRLPHRYCCMLIINLLTKLCLIIISV